MAMAMPPPGGPPASSSGLYWQVPTPYGYPASVDAGGTVAAPLLAGFSLTLIGVILGAGNPGEFRVRDPALVALVAATLLLLACVQCSFWARQFTVTPTQIMEWWPELRAPGGNPDRHEQLRAEQWRYALMAKRWLHRARLSYQGGIILLLAGMTLLLVPADGNGWRWLAVAVMGLGFAAELYWTVAPSRRGWPGVRALFPLPRDVMHLPDVQPGAYTGPEPQP